MAPPARRTPTEAPSNGSGDRGPEARRSGAFPAPIFTMSRALAILVTLLVAGATYYQFTPRGLDVQVLDVSGYADNVPTWMTFRVTLGLFNADSQPTTIERVSVAPDLEGFNEAYNVGTYELQPPLRIEPGSRASYQATATLLNAAQLQEGTYRFVLRVRIEADGSEVVTEFPAAYEHRREPTRRALRFPDR